MFEKLETALWRSVNWCAFRPWRGALTLIIVALVVLAPGLRSLPPVDRTEVFYAQAARQMLESGDALVPRYRDSIDVGRPIGMLWLQATASRLLSASDRAEIASYRVPSLVGAILAIIALFLLAGRLVGHRVAFLAALVVTCSFSLALQARLAIPQTWALAMVIISQLCLARILLAPTTSTDPSDRLAAPPPPPTVVLMFWSALGVGLLVNSLIVPLLAGVTVSVLALTARDARWLRALLSLPGIAFFCAMAGAWGISLYLSATTAIAPKLSLWTWADTVIDPQGMKWRTLPGSFLVVAWLGLLPANLLLWQSVMGLWRRRKALRDRFLLTWAVGFLAAFEIALREPPLYMVQYAIPPLAIAIALLVCRTACEPTDQRLRLPAAIPWMWLCLGAVLAAVPLALPKILRDPVPTAAILGALAIAALFLAASLAARRRTYLSATLLSLLAGVVLFHVTITAVLTGASQPWPSQSIARLHGDLRRCYAGPLVLSGYPEPSAVFLLGRDVMIEWGPVVVRQLVAKPTSLAFVDRSELGHFAKFSKKFGLAYAEISCVRGWNVFTGRRVELHVFANARNTVAMQCRTRIANLGTRCPRPLPPAEGQRTNDIPRLTPRH